MPFSQDLDQWTGYFALAGGAAATLLGLLFVSVSLRLEIFHLPHDSHLRLFASFARSIFLIVAAIAGLTLAPHEQPERIAKALAVIAIGGLLAAANWTRLSLTRFTPDAPVYPDAWRGWVIMGGAAATLGGLLAVSWLLENHHPDALGYLAIVEGVFLVIGTHAAWLMLSHAGNTTIQAATGATLSDRQRTADPTRSL